MLTMNDGRGGVGASMAVSMPPRTVPAAGDLAGPPVALAGPGSEAGKAGFFAAASRCTRSIRAVAPTAPKIS